MSEQKIDILNREEFINRVIQLVQLISSNKGNMTFAIDGSWGCGKTFVLEKIERRLSEDESKKYLVIHYNCWQYDYYDEPLVAIVAALKDAVDTTSFIPEDTKIEVRKVFAKVGISVLTQIVKNTTGFDIEKTTSEIKEAFGEASEAVTSQHDYDVFCGFKTALTSLQQSLKKLSEEYILVFAVDELDRCLPEYSINVLERLHHITEALQSAITIIAIDKDRLNTTIKGIFGEDNAADYLRKFIHFEVKLESGKPSGKDFLTKFHKFTDRFDPTLYGQLSKTDRFIEELFFGIDARAQEHIVEKAIIFNDLCFGSKKQDYTMMYMMLFMAMLHYYYGEGSIFSDKKRVMDPLNVFDSCQHMPSVFKTQYSGFCFDKHDVFLSYPNRTLLIDTKDVFMVVFYYWYQVPKPNSSLTIYKTELIPQLDQPNPRLDENIEKLRRNIQLLEIVK